MSVSIFLQYKTTNDFDEKTLFLQLQKLRNWIATSR